MNDQTYKRTKQINKSKSKCLNKVKEEISKSINKKKN